MILTEEQIVELGKDPKASEWIEGARKTSKHLKMHYYGTGLTEYLTQVQGLENKSQIELRKKYAISNKSLISSLLRPVDNAWSAKGGMVNVDSTDSVKKELKESIEERGDRTPREYLKDVWFDRFITDPNGLLFMESNENEAYPVYKSIFDINKMLVKGAQPEYVVFEPHEVIEDEITFVGEVPKRHQIFWIVDDAFYYKVKRSNDSVVILDSIVNTFGVVPAIQNSPILDTETRIKVSPIDKQVELLNDYLIDNSINNIYKKLHGFPLFWFYTGKCESCKGTGEIEGETCSSCNGSAQSMKKDVSDGIPLKTPSDSDAPTIAPNIAGYVQPDLETWREQRTELEHIFNIIYFSHWGTTIEKADNETATGRFIDAQPVVNRLHQYSDTFESVNTKLLELYAKYYAPTSDVKVTVSYGRRYLIETPDQIWKKYLETLEKGADNSSKDLQLEQYYESEFQTDEFLRKYYLKLIKVEPLVHYSIDDVLSMNVSQEIKDMKVAFPTWKAVTPMTEVIDTEADKLIIKLKEFTDESKEKLQSPQEVGAVEA